MKNTLIAIVILILSSTSFAGSLDVYGFEIIQNTSEKMELKHFKGVSLIISKNRFTEQKSAEAFCASMGSSLDTKFKALLIAMSGAAKVDKFLNETISFNYKNGNKTASGIWEWSGKNNTISIMMDGQGAGIETAPVEELRQVMTDLSLPAICLNQNSF